MGLVDQIISVESGGDPSAKNQASSASGVGQFLDGTWLSMLQQHRPDLVEGKSADELLALKSDPQLSREMTEAYAADNGKILSQAGLPVNPGTQYLAHFAGPQGAVKVLSADPSAPVASILGEAAVKANPFLQGMTAADLQAWASRKMGGATQQPSGQTAPASPAGPAMAQSAPQLQKPAQQAITPNQIAALQQPQQPGSSLFGQIPASQMAAPPPIFYAPRKQIDLSKLQAALQASGNRGPIFKG